MRTNPHEILRDDGFHLNDKGAEQLAKEWIRTIEEAHTTNTNNRDHDNQQGHSSTHNRKGWKKSQNHERKTPDHNNNSKRQPQQPHNHHNRKQRPYQRSHKRHKKNHRNAIRQQM